MTETDMTEADWKRCKKEAIRALMLDEKDVDKFKLVHHARQFHPLRTFLYSVKLGFKTFFHIGV